MDQAHIARKIADEVSRIVVGKLDVIEAMLVALLAEGNVLMEGVPGTGKTLIAKIFSQAIGGSFRRIQMTPDLLPADILGTSIFNARDGSFSIRRGPVFANVVMADELNRATPRTQAAMIEAMQERQVTIEGDTMPLPRPFIVIATQLPPGGAGTYPLTEVQLDRFAARVDVTNPSRSEEKTIMANIDSLDSPVVTPQAEPRDVMDIIDSAKKVHVSESVRDYVADLVLGLRARKDLRLGPGTRASIWLYKMSRSRALLQGRDHVLPDDVKALATNVLLHRMTLTPESEAEDISASSILQDALRGTPVPKGR